MTFENGKIKERPLVYLAGAISGAKDNGAIWRTEITPHLSNLGYRIFNPVIEQPRISGVTIDLLESQKGSNFDLYRESCKKVVETDLNILRKCSLVVCKLEDSVFRGAGTFGELTISNFLDIPVFAWVDLPGGLASVPYWAMGCITSFSLHERDFYRLIPTADAFIQKHTMQDFFDSNKPNSH